MTAPRGLLEVLATQRDAARFAAEARQAYRAPFGKTPDEIAAMQDRAGFVAAVARGLAEGLHTLARQGETR